MMYVAFPLYADETLVGVLRTSLAVTAIDERIGAIRWRIGVGAMLVALLASGISWFVSRRITQPIGKDAQRPGGLPPGIFLIAWRCPTSGSSRAWPKP
jgi:hypothetical protein